MATYGRGRHTLPSIRSVLGQVGVDFELLVVGDACTDETEGVVKGIGDPRVRWLNLDARIGSQSGPNNAGIAAARAGVIAYLGHDDIWEPDHLTRMLDVYRKDTADVVVSGMLLHPPPGVGPPEVMGLIPEGADFRPYFFPPSGLSHLREVMDRIGGWRMPWDIRAPVDDDLLLRAAAAGMHFRSTGVVTVHKFSAAQRYLSYLRPASDEQEAMLRSMGQYGHAECKAALVEAARASGRFMVPARRDYDSVAPGELYRQSIERRGARDVSLVALGGGTVVRHRVEPTNLDWKDELKLGFRRNRSNPRPRLLVPVTGGRARLCFAAAHHEAAALGPITLDCNGILHTARPGWRWFGLVAWFARYEAEIELQADRPTVLELVLSELQQPRGKRRKLSVGPLHLKPI